MTKELTILKKIDEINWSELRTSFSRPATDVPHSLRRLISAKNHDRDDVIDLLSADLCNSYQVNTATVAAVPILLELLESSDTPVKLIILSIFRDSFYGTKLTNSNNSLIEVNVGREIAKGLDLYIELLQHPDWEVRRIVWIFLKNVDRFPDEARSQLNHALQSFILAEKHPDVVSSIRWYLERPDDLPRRFYPDDVE